MTNRFSGWFQFSCELVCPMDFKTCFSLLNGDIYTMLWCIFPDKMTFFSRFEFKQCRNISFLLECLLVGCYCDVSGRHQSHGARRRKHFKPIPFNINVILLVLCSCYSYLGYVGLCVIGRLQSAYRGGVGRSKQLKSVLNEMPTGCIERNQLGHQMIYLGLWAEPACLD